MALFGASLRSSAVLRGGARMRHICRNLATEAAEAPAAAAGPIAFSKSAAAKATVYDAIKAPPQSGKLAVGLSSAGLLLTGIIVYNMLLGEEMDVTKPHPSIPYPQAEGASPAAAAPEPKAPAAPAPAQQAPAVAVCPIFGGSSTSSAND
jgi:hypothetical protein